MKTQRNLANSSYFQLGFHHSVEKVLARQLLTGAEGSRHTCQAVTVGHSAPSVLGTSAVHGAEQGLRREKRAADTLRNRAGGTEQQDKVNDISSVPRCLVISTVLLCNRFWSLFPASHQQPE